jgi:hypothetical protein
MREQFNSSVRRRSKKGKKKQERQNNSFFAFLALLALFVSCFMWGGRYSNPDVTSLDAIA